MSDTKLDVTTELCIGALRDAATDYQHARDHGKEVRWSEVTHAETVLRDRIRELVNEARIGAYNTAETATTRTPHD